MIEAVLEPIEGALASIRRRWSDDFKLRVVAKYLLSRTTAAYRSADRRRAGGNVCRKHLAPWADESTADLCKHDVFEQLLSAVRGRIEELHTLDTAKKWIQHMVDNLHGRR